MLKKEVLYLNLSAHVEKYLTYINLPMLFLTLVVLLL